MAVSVASFQEAISLDELNKGDVRAKRDALQALLALTRVDDFRREAYRYGKVLGLEEGRSILPAVLPRFENPPVDFLNEITSEENMQKPLLALIIVQLDIQQQQLDRDALQKLSGLEADQLREKIKNEEILKHIDIHALKHWLLKQYEKRTHFIYQECSSLDFHARRNNSSLSEYLIAPRLDNSSIPPVTTTVGQRQKMPSYDYKAIVLEGSDEEEDQAEFFYSFVKKLTPNSEGLERVAELVQGADGVVHYIPSKCELNEQEKNAVAFQAALLALQNYDPTQGPICINGPDATEAKKVQAALELIISKIPFFHDQDIKIENHVTNAHSDKRFYETRKKANLKTLGLLGNETYVEKHSASLVGLIASRVVQPAFQSTSIALDASEADKQKSVFSAIKEKFKRPAPVLRKYDKPEDSEGDSFTIPPMKR